MRDELDKKIERRTFIGLMIKGIVAGGALFSLSSLAYSATCSSGNVCDCGGNKNRCKGQGVDNSCSGNTCSYGNNCRDQANNNCNGEQGTNVCPGHNSNICYDQSANNCGGQGTTNTCGSTQEGTDWCWGGSNNNCIVGANNVCSGDRSNICRGAGTENHCYGTNTCTDPSISNLCVDEAINRVP